MICKEARLPQTYDNYVFDLYGTLVDIRTREDDPVLWKKLALFYGYYDAAYEPDELREAYGALVAGKENALKNRLEENPRYSHEASPEIEITDVFLELYTAKGVEADRQLAIHTGQFFRVLSTDYVRLYPGTEEMLSHLKEHGKKIYLLSNAQRIFTEYEMHVLGIASYFDGILISSDHKTKKPDKRFFDLLLSQYHLDVEKSLFIGNDSTTDIAGARQIGMDTYYVKSNISPAKDMADADYVVSHFTHWK
jgi:putative hydrolase of the HAD superfamily